MKTELTPWGLCLLFLCIIALLFTAFSQIGCASTPMTPMSANESAAWTAANTLLTTDIANGSVLTKDLIGKALAATHNSGDARVVEDAAVLGEKVIQAQIAAKAAGASPVAQQAITSTILSDPSVIQVVAAGAPAPATSMLKFNPDMHPRAREGWICWENVY